MTQDTLSPQLARQHEALVRELDHIRGQLPDNAEDMSEAFERYARTLAGDSAGRVFRRGKVSALADTRANGQNAHAACRCTGRALG